MAANTQPDSVPGTHIASWRAAHDDDDRIHCAQGIATLLEDLSQPATTALGDTAELAAEEGDIDTLQSLTRTAIDTLEPPNGGDSAIDVARSELTDLVTQLGAHTHCSCGSEEWQESANDLFNSLIDEVSSGTWAIFHVDDHPAGEATGLVVGDLWQAVGNNDGWSSITLAWDPKGGRLTFSFGARPSMFYGYATPLSAAQVDLAQRLANLAPYTENVACVVAAGDTVALELVTHLWGDSAAEVWAALAHVYSDDLLAAITAVTGQVHGLPPHTRAAATSLAHGWQAGLDQLLTTAAAVATAPIAA